MAAPHPIGFILNPAFGRTTELRQLREFTHEFVRRVFWAHRSRREVARRLGCSERTLQRWLADCPDLEKA